MWCFSFWSTRVAANWHMVATSERNGFLMFLLVLMSSRNNVVLVNVFYKLLQFSGLSWSQLIDMFHLSNNNNNKKRNTIITREKIIHGNSNNNNNNKRNTIITREKVIHGNSNNNSKRNTITKEKYMHGNSKNNIKKRNTITREKIAWQWQWWYQK